MRTGRLCCAVYFEVFYDCCLLNSTKMSKKTKVVNITVPAGATLIMFGNESGVPVLKWNNLELKNNFYKKMQKNRERNRKRRAKRKMMKLGNDAIKEENKKIEYEKRTPKESEVNKGIQDEVQNESEDPEQREDQTQMTAEFKAVFKDEVD